MNEFKQQIPRAAVAFGAVGIAALTLSALVVAPAVLDSRFEIGAAIARQSAAPIEVAISPARIEVVGVREPNVAWATSEQGKPNCKPET